MKLCNTPIVAAMAFCRPLALAGQAVSPFLDQRSASGDPEPFSPCLKGSCIDMSLFDSCSPGPYMNCPPASSSLSPRLCCCSLGRPSPSPGTDSLRMAQGPSVVCLCLLLPVSVVVTHPEDAGHAADRETHGAGLLSPLTTVVLDRAACLNLSCRSVFTCSLRT